MSDAQLETRLQQILESCYAAVCDGAEPDLDSLCSDAPELRGRVERLLARERTLLKACIDDSSERELPSAPDRLGDYVVLEPIGIGGMSNVFRARQEPLGREVALKVLRDDVVASPTGRLRFTREATITASLEHPHIVPVYGAGEADGHVYLAMKLLRGHSLDRQRTAFPPQQVARIGCEIASALAAAHEVGVVHRDIKPANIVLEHGSVFVVDFGLAAFADRASLLTQPNSTPGTLIYLPPEVAGRKASSLDPRADVYGIGATLYELLAGHPPFDPSNPVRALRQILHDEPRPLELKGRDRDLETIVLHAMDKSPDRRFQSAAELGAELQRYRDGLPILTRPPGPLARLARTVHRHPVVSALVAIILMLSTLLTTQAALQSLEDERQLARSIAAVDDALAVGDLAAADDRLQQLATIADDVTAGTLRRRYRQAFDRQLFVLALSHPVTRSLDGYLAELRDQVEGTRPDLQRQDSPQLAAALALARWQLTGAPVQPARDDVTTAMPRLAALLAVAPDATAVGRALARIDARRSHDGEWHEHLLCAAAMRFAKLPEPAVERELRRAERSPHAAALHFSLAISLEAQGRHREAYETILQLRRHPVCGRLARWSIARLAALLGETATARSLLAAASAEPEQNALLLELAVPSKLQILSEGPADVFWEHWRQAPARNQRMAHYWRMASYVKSGEAESLAEVDEAIALLDEGVPFARDDVQRAGLEIGICQTRWLKHAIELGSAGEDEISPQMLDELLTTATRSERLADRCERLALPVTITTDALLTAANCRIERREWALARELLDRAARYDEPLPLAEYALQVARMVATELLAADSAAPADSFGDLRVAAHLALDRARRATLQRQRSRDFGEREHAACEAARILCSCYLGEARAALPAARAWSPSGDPIDQALSVITERIVRWGGAILDSSGIPTERLPRVVLQAAALVEEEWRAGHFEGDEVRAIVTRWRQHPRVASRLPGPAWLAVREALAQLLDAVAKGR